MAISIQDVHAAADQLVAAGQTPTLAAIRATLGGGSYTTISEAMKAWRAQKAQASMQTIKETAPSQIIERATEFAGVVWATARTLADERIAAERQALEQARAELERERLEAAGLADDLAAELDAARATISEQQARLAQASALAEQLAAARAALEEAQRRADELARLLEEERKERQRAQERLEAAMAEASRLRGMLDALQQRV